MFNKIKYKYILENKVNKHYNIINSNNTKVLCLCYHINTNNKYPYIQFLLLKNTINQYSSEYHFNLPFFFINNDNIYNIENIIIETLQLNKNNIEYLGIIDNTFIISNEIIILLNILDIEKLNEQNSQLFITIPTEIINYKHISNIIISDYVVDLFTNNFHNLCILYNVYQNNIYPLPDILYSVNEYYLCKLEYLFKRFKNNIHNQGNFLCFYRQYKNIKNNTCFCNSNKEFGINRYIAFIENYICVNDKDKYNIRDLLLVYNTILFQNNYCKDYDIIIKDYDNIESLNYYKLTNNI